MLCLSLALFFQQSKSWRDSFCFGGSYLICCSGKIFCEFVIEFRRCEPIEKPRFFPFHEMKLLSSIVTVITVLLAAPRAFGNMLHFENMEVSTGALTDISNDGPPEEGTCCCRLSWWAVSYQPSGSTGPWRLPPPTIIQLQRIVYSSNQFIKKPHTHAHFCVCLAPP